MLGGSFLSRINMNLREQKHWSYGAGAYFFETKTQGLYIAYAPVQTDKTKESIVELQKELTDINGNHPITEEEFKKEQTATLLEIPGRWETNSGVRATLQSAILYNRGIDYPKNYASIIEHLTLNDISKASKELINPKVLTWLIVGDRKKIEAGIKELNLGPLKFLDKDGNEIK